MGTSDSEISRLLAGGVPIDDPAFGDVSAFLADVQDSLPPLSVRHLEDSHLAAIGREAKALQSARAEEWHALASRVRRRSRRTLATAAITVLGVLSAGVGVATAVGLIPIEDLIPALRPTPQLTRGVPSGSYDPSAHATRPPTSVPSPSPARATTPSAAPTPHQTTPGKASTDKAKSNNGKSGTAKSNNTKSKSQSNKGKPTKPKSNNGKSPTAKPTNGKSNGKSG